ncbi:glycosyltransferase family 2 protein [Vibrio harveyi]|uniref:glycosyltransferase family 2 protein n=1 Tax=Vibrio harveyi TaxID=669 RepID=UPI000C79AC0C|nr:glycosyltransferase family 2 protein [Vibrio harveyi]AWA98780.1 glycosyltransferase family 2 protein [Vibrio harveyi]GBK99353.1 glycosyltransferase family 2 protein [Vibrio harveyi]
MFSIIIPTYKRIVQLSNLIESLECQSLEGFEVIIINDDPDMTLTKEMLSSSLDLKVINNSVNMGPSASRNIGALAAAKSWLTFLDDDDRFANEKLASIKSVIDSKPSTKVVYNGARINLVDYNISYVTKPIRPDSLKSIARFNTLGGAPLLSIFKDSFIELGMFDTNLPALEDYDLNIRIVRSNIDFVVTKEILTECYYDSQLSISKIEHSNFRSLSSIFEKYPDLYDAKTKKDCESWLYGSLAFKSLLTGCKMKATKNYYRAFLLKPSLRSVIMILLSLLPSKFVFQLRERMS